LSSLYKISNFKSSILILIVLLSGCGYSIQKSSSVDSVRLGKIENRSYEPKLEDRFYEALMVGLMKNGIRINENSGYTVMGTIDSFDLKSLAEREGLTVSYEVVIKGRFFLEGPDGKKRELRSRGVFIVSFSGGGRLETVLASRDEAIERALSDMSEAIAASIIYQ
jgi:hypothetical protein